MGSSHSTHRPAHPAMDQAIAERDQANSAYLLAKLEQKKARSEFLVYETAAGAWVQLLDLSNSLHDFGVVADALVSDVKVATVEQYGRSRKIVEDAATTGSVGLFKLLHPDSAFTHDELQMYLELALEGRRRVKEQLRRMGGLEYWAVNFSYLDKETHQETCVAAPEQGGGGLIPAGLLDRGVVFAVGSDQEDGRLAIFRVEVQAAKGSGNAPGQLSANSGGRSRPVTTATPNRSAAARNASSR